MRPDTERDGEWERTMRELHHAVNAKRPDDRSPDAMAASIQDAFALAAQRARSEEAADIATIVQILLMDRSKARAR